MSLFLSWSVCVGFARLNHYLLYYNIICCYYLSIRDIFIMDILIKYHSSHIILSVLISLIQGPPIGIDTPLVDAEGYPRGDIDIYRARSQRKRFKEIQTDYKALEKKIDIGLAESAALINGEEKQQSTNVNGVSATSEEDDEEEKKARLAPKPKPKFDPKTGKWVVKNWDGSVAGVENGETRSFEDLSATSTSALASNLPGGRSSAASTANSTGTNVREGGGSAIQQNATSVQQRMQNVTFQEQATIPFAIIDEVTPNSPAFDAGIKENDILLRFGSVNSHNHRDFRAIAELLPIAASENKSISVAVRRTTTELGGFVEVIKTEVMELKPRPWGGRGLLGCHIKPYSE